MINPSSDLTLTSPSGTTFALWYNNQDPNMITANYRPLIAREDVTFNKINFYFTGSTIELYITD